MGRLREVCGTVSGGLMVIGQLYGYGTPDKGEAKARLYAIEQEFARRFAAVHGSCICRDLLGLSAGPSVPTPEARTAEYYKKRPCPALCKSAADLLDELIDDRVTGAVWTEYYRNGRPYAASCPYRPWESAINLCGILAYLNAVR